MVRMIRIGVVQIQFTPGTGTESPAGDRSERRAAAATLGKTPGTSARLDAHEIIEPGAPVLTNGAGASGGPGSQLRRAARSSDFRFSRAVIRALSRLTSRSMPASSVFVRCPSR